MGMIFTQTEKFKVNKTASDSESGDASAPGVAKVILDLLFDVEDAALLIEHGIHD